MKNYNDLMDGKKILFGAHRGDRENYPENTMPAFMSAIEIGCDVIETDVRMTKDGELVLIHDRDVKRTTNGNGFVDEMTLQEIKKLDAGFWKGDKFIGEKIPTAEELLQLCTKSKTMINWELKEYPLELGDRAYVLIDKLVELIDKYDMSKKSIMNSFSEKVLEYVADKWPNKFAIHGYIDYKNPIDFSDKPLVSFLDWAAIWNKSEENIAGFEKDYDYAKDNDILCCILVPDTEDAYKKAIDLGCKMFTSDKPGVGIGIVKKLVESN